MNIERAKTILTETLFSKGSNSPNDLVSLSSGRHLIADSLIYRLTFDSEDDDDVDDDGRQLFTSNYANNNLKLSLDVNGNDVNQMINGWSTDANQHDDHNNKGDDTMKINDPEIENPMVKSRGGAIKLNVSSLADEIIDSEMNSLKCLQQQFVPPTVTTIKDNYVNECNQMNVKTIDNSYNGKLAGQCPSNNQNKRQIKSLILPSLVRTTINTEISMITYNDNYPSTRACLSCCLIS